MTRLAPLFAQSGSYSARLFRLLGGTMLPAGGVNGMTATVQASSMNIQIAPGVAVVSDNLNPRGVYVCGLDAPETVTLPTAAPAGQSRYDLICVQPREPSGDWVFNIVSSALAANQMPTVPAAPAGQVPVALQLVPGGAAVLASNQLSDARPWLGNVRAGTEVLTTGPAGGFTIAWTRPMTATPIFTVSDGDSSTTRILVLGVRESTRTPTGFTGDARRSDNTTVNNALIRLNYVAVLP